VVEVVMWSSGGGCEVGGGSARGRWWLKSKSGRDRVLMKHPDGVKRDICQIHACESQRLGKNIMRHGHNVTSAFRRLEYIEHLAYARPEQFRHCPLAEYLHTIFHQRHRINPGSGNSPGKNRHDGGGIGVKGFGHGLYLVWSEDGGGVELKTLICQISYQRNRRVSAGIRNRYLHINIVLPPADLVSLAVHLGKLVRENLK